MHLQRAIAKALRLRADLGLDGVATPADVDRAIALVGLDRWPDGPMPHDLYGVYFAGVLRVREGLLPGTSAWVAAHEAGHHVLGHGRGAFRAPLAGGTPPAGEHEEATDVFAYTLVLGAPASTRAGIDRQLHAGYAAGWPLAFLFGAVNVLARRRPCRLAPVRRRREPTTQGQFGAELFH